MTRLEYLQRAREFASRGEGRHNAKLDKSKVSWIRSNHDGLTAKAQAAILCVHYRTVEKVRHFETWVHVK